MANRAPPRAGGARNATPTTGSGSGPGGDRPRSQFIHLVSDIRKLEPKRPVRIQHVRHAIQLFFLFFMTFTLVGHMLQPFLPVLPLVLPVVMPEDAATPDWFAGPDRHIVTQYSVAARAVSGVWPLWWAIMPIGAVLLFGSIFGRVMCGWACPIGSFQDLLAGLGRRLGIRHWEPSTRLHRVLLAVKYLSLGLTILIAVSIGVAASYGPEVKDAYFHSLPEGVRGEVPLKPLSFEGNLYTFLLLVTKGIPLWTTVVTLQIVFWTAQMILMVITPRFYCRYMCRTGALISITNKWALLQVRKNHQTCDGNNNCRDVCPMGKGQNTYAKGKEPLLETLNCVHAHLCVESCPTPTLSIELAKSRLWRSAWWTGLAGGGRKGKSGPAQRKGADIRRAPRRPAS